MGRGTSMKEQQDLAETTRFSGGKSSIFKSDYPEYKAREGDNYIKILPPKDYKDNLDSPFGIYIFVHWEGTDVGPVLCPKRMKNVMEFLVSKKVIDEIPEEIKDGKCPICEEQARVYSSTGGDKGHPNFDLAKSLHPQEKLLLFVIDTSNDNEIDKGVQIYQVPSTNVWKKGIYPLSQPKRGKNAGETIDISSPENKKDVYFNREGMKLKSTSYSGFELVDSELSIEEVEEFINDLPDSFADVLNFISYDEIKENVVEPEVDNEEEEKPTSRRRTSRAPKEGEEEEKPTSRRRSSRVPEEEEPEQTNEEDEEREKTKAELRREFRRRKNSDD